MTSTRTDTYALAHLAGGTSRVADTAVVALLARGRLRVDGGGLLRAAGTGPVHPVEAAVLDVVGTRPTRSALTVRAQVHDDPRVTAVADGLAAAGLLRPGPRGWLSRSRSPLVCTRAGRAVLADARQQADAGEDQRVALDGVTAMADAAQRVLVFGTDPGRGRPAGGPRRSDGRWATGSSGSFAAWGGGDGGGGGWGGDGGGCGGDGGGGGC